MKITTFLKIIIPVAIMTLISLLAVGCQKVDTATNFKYIVEKNEITITGYKGNLKAIIIPDKIAGKNVTKIGDMAFKDYTLTSVTLPDTLTYIGLNAFEYCVPLTSINIPDSVKTIDNDAFNGCGLLTSITIPEGVTSINEDVFQNCDSLISITLPDSLTSIGYHSFGNCTSLTNVTIPAGVTSIANYAFGNCTSLTSVTIPDNVAITDGAFWGCNSLTTETRDKISQINPHAFDKNW
ncbi:MAG: leucine-rich repeat domain-containing protein [Oscillospiraceae bacterium]|nr:leucine-rich repeat domain-containing protein [Oscillospiraceae bacterium]